MRGEIYFERLRPFSNPFHTLLSAKPNTYKKSLWRVTDHNNEALDSIFLSSIGTNIQLI